MLGLIDLLIGRNRFEEIVTPQHLANHRAVSPELLAEIRSSPQEFKRFI